MYTLGLEPSVWDFLRSESDMEYIDLNDQPFAQFWNPGAVEHLTFLFATVITHNLVMGLACKPAVKLRRWKALLAAAMATAGALVRDDTSEWPDTVEESAKQLRVILGVPHEVPSKLTDQEVQVITSNMSNKEKKKLCRILLSAKVPKAFFRVAELDVQLALARAMLHAAFEDPEKALRGE